MRVLTPKQKQEKNPWVARGEPRDESNPWNDFFSENGFQ